MKITEINLPSFRPILIICRGYNCTFFEGYNPFGSRQWCRADNHWIDEKRICLSYKRVVK